jgi:hypothetical protein
MDLMLSTTMKLHQLRGELEQVIAGRDVALKELAEARRQRDEAVGRADRLHNALTKRTDAPFSREDMESMGKPRLLSLIDEAVSEARRKGLVEAEALVQKHERLLKETDLEVMRGVVKTYQDRIAARESELAMAAKPAPRLDQSHSRWWDDTPVTSFKTFDEKVTAAAEAKRRSEAPRTIADGGQVHVDGDSGTTYQLTHKGAVYSCTCPSWHWSKVPTDQRTCKHLMTYLGTGAENARILAARAAAPKYCWCGVTLVRGQCQIHTANWSGDEYCNCGRRFSFCKTEFASGRSPIKDWHEPRLVGTPEPERTANRRK